MEHSNPFSGLIAHQRNGENQSRVLGVEYNRASRKKGEAAPHVPLKNLPASQGDFAPGVLGVSPNKLDKCMHTALRCGHIFPMLAI